MGSSAAQDAASYAVALPDTVQGVTSYTFGGQGDLFVQSFAFTLNMSLATDDVMPTLAYFAPTGERIAQNLIWPGVVKQAVYVVKCSFELGFPYPRPAVLSNFADQTIKDPFRVAGIPDLALTYKSSITLTLYKHGTFGNNNPVPDNANGVATSVIMWVTSSGGGGTIVDVPLLPPLLTHEPINTIGGAH